MKFNNSHVDLDEIEEFTIAHYEDNAESFRVGTKDHDVSQNIDAFLSALPKEKNLDILDFGCGPGPALAQMLRDSGYKMDLYDPLFWDDNSALEKSYDFVTCTETIEHFSNPASDFALLDSVVKDEGVLAVMTSILYKEVIFEDWYYKLDPTHVSFYTPSTMEWISNKFNWAIESAHKNVYFFIK